MEKRPFFLSTSDGLSLYGCDWPVREAEAVVCLVHGLGEHILRYSHVADFFNKDNLAVIGLDRRGHGQSEGKRGHISSYKQLFEELQLLLEMANKRYPGTPKILYGHSQGGSIVLSYFLENHPQVAGIIASAPWIRLSFKPPSWMLSLAKIMASVYPAYSQHNQLNTNYLSRDSKVVEAYNKDDLVTDRITAGTTREMIKLATFLDNYSGNIAVPLLIMHGSADQITSHQASREFAARVQGPIKFKLWDGFFHEIHNEPEREEVLAFVSDWIQQVLAARNE